MSDAPTTIPHLWWTKRLLLAAGMLVILLTLTRLWWGWIAHRRLQHELDLITAAGEPVLRAQIQTPSVPDTDNAALLWRQAADAVNDDVQTPSQSNLAEPSYPPHSVEWNRLMQTGINGNVEAIALAWQASQKPRSNWDGLATSSSIIGIPNWGGVRNLTNVLGDAAQYAHDCGNDDEAIQRILDVRHLADSIKTRSDSISYLTAIGIESFSLSKLLLLAPDLQVVEDGNATTTARSAIIPASRRQIQALIRELWTASQPNPDVHHLSEVDRIWDLETFAAAGRSSPLLRPMYELDAARILQWRAIIVRSADAPNWPAARTLLNASATEASLSMNRSRSKSAPPRFSRWISYQLYFGSLSEVEFRIRRDRQFAAVALATRLYYLDHQAWPRSLDELTSAYLAGKTFDGLAPDGRPLGYLLAKTSNGIRPVVYGVEPKYNVLTAPTAADLPSTPSFVFTDGHWQIRDLSRWYPAPPSSAPSSQAVDH